MKKRAPARAAIRARCDAASPAPWSVGSASPGDVSERQTLVWPAYGAGAPVCRLERPGAPTKDKADATFIAHARQDVPALLDAGDAALRAAVAAVYFADNSDYLAALWSVVRALDPALADLLARDPRAAFDATHPEIAAEHAAADGAP